MIRIASLAAALILTAACSPSQTPADTTQVEGPVLSYTDAFVMAPIAGRDLTMGGIELSVSGGDVRLVGASSDAFDAIELHTMSMTDGKMTMRPVTGFDLADGETLTLARGGHHFMMFDLTRELAGGDTVDLTLSFEADGGTMTLVVEANVRAVGE